MLGFVSYFSLVFIFLAEMSLNMAASGLRKYFMDPLLVIDFIVVTLSFIEAGQDPPIVISDPGQSNLFQQRSFGMGLLAW